MIEDTYLGAHYELLREDAVRPLREAVGRVRTTPTAAEDAFGDAVGIYEKVSPSSRSRTRMISLKIIRYIFAASPVPAAVLQFMSLFRFCELARKSYGSNQNAW